MKKLLTLSLLLASFVGQAQTYTRADSLRGTLHEFRANFDVKYYHLDLEIILETQSIKGSNLILFKATKPINKIQLDLFANMQVDSILHHGKKLVFSREGNIIWINFDQTIAQGATDQIKVYYQGTPTIAKRPPWDGGFTWTQDERGNPWIAVSCEGIGASLWWPNKDHLSDEPDSMLVSTTVPNGLFSVGNGRLRGIQKIGADQTRFEWFVSKPINNYNISLNIAKYARIQDVHTYADGTKLDLEYYVLSYNEQVAEKHFQQVKPMLDCFAKYFGPYPFIEDSYKLVETPYWGMEHQSAIAYGNHYKNNEFGFDFIIIHESGHEYFGNSVSVNDHADMWIHEALTTYMEALYLECLKDKTTAIAWMETQKAKIKNVMAIQGDRGVNFEAWPDADMYFKGTWMLHSIRHTLDNDALWFEMLRKTYEHYKIGHANSEDFIAHLDQQTDKNLEPIFRQYLTTTYAPKLVYEEVRKGKKVELKYKWEAVEGFNMSTKVKWGNGEYKTLNPTAEWQTLKVKAEGDIKFATELFYFEPIKNNP